MVEVHRNGLTKLSKHSESATPESRCNIVFIHGLRGHPRKTWEGQLSEDTSTSASTIPRKGLFSRLRKSQIASKEANIEQTSKKIFWPQELLAEDIPNATIWTYGYNADVIGIFDANNQNNVSQHGRGLAAALERERDINNDAPLIFIVHSLGGIVLKDALRRSDSCQQRTRLIIFLGTPHRGSPAADMGQIAANLARLALQDSNKDILRNLQVDSEILENIHEEFAKIALQRSIAIHSFQESRGMTGIKGLSGKVVNNFSSRLDLPTIETLEPIDADHRQMARCSRREDETYRKVFGELEKRIRNGVLKSDLSISDSLMASQGQQILSASLPQKRHILLPFAPNKRFTGRQDALNTLEHNLFIAKESQRLAIVGLGGVGKTQLALAFSYVVKEKYSDCSIFWVSAVSTERFKQDCSKIAKKCSIGAESEGDESIRAVQEYLSNENSGKWLLVIDNSDDTAALFEGGIMKNLPQRENGIILFTTRYRHIAVDVAGSSILNLEKMDLAEAKMFLQRASNRVEDEKAVEELLEELTYLPLAINQASSYMIKASVTIAEYLKLMRDTEEEMVKLLSRDFQDSAGDSIRNAVAMTWLVSFELIKRDELDAANILFFLASIENKAIPHSILPAVQSKGDMIHAIGVLRGYSFLTKQDNSETYDMHRLVHLAVKIWMQKEGIVDRWNRKTISHLADIFPPRRWKNRSIYQAYMPHTIRVLQDTERLASEKRALLCYRIGSYLYNDGRRNEAIKWMEECVSWRDLSLSEDHVDRLTAQRALARTYQLTGKMNEAIRLLERVVAIEAGVFAGDRVAQLPSLLELGEVYIRNGQTKEGIGLFKNLVAIDTKVLAEDCPTRLSVLRQLAQVYIDGGRIKEGVKLLETVASIRTRVLAEDHPDQLSTQYCLARAYFRADNQSDKAISLMQNVVTVEQRVLRADHPDRIKSERYLSKMLRVRNTNDLSRDEAR